MFLSFLVPNNKTTMSNIINNSVTLKPRVRTPLFSQASRDYSARSHRLMAAALSSPVTVARTRHLFRQARAPEPRPQLRQHGFRAQSELLQHNQGVEP
jgi:hypothetical protein